MFVAWLNLDIGIDVCFLDGLDTYTKTWLQLAFPVYIISLVIGVIKVSEYSPRFARLIGRRDPAATLATLVLLSYAKLLSVTIIALSFAVLDYPDGSRETVWLPDGNVKYLQGKHIALVLVAHVDYSNRCPLHCSSLSLAVASSCSKVGGFQVDKKHQAQCIYLCPSCSFQQ